MAESVDKEKARKLLAWANAQEMVVDDEMGAAVRDILNGSRKTYKYVMVNALLAKAVNPNVDALCLQAGDESEGAYDARSLCHEVLVPFERQCYNGSLGGSNEPFLNKPARAKRLVHDNPVRPGNDKRTLDKLVDLLGRIKTKAQAKKYLAVAISEMDVICRTREESFHMQNLPVGEKGNVQAVLDYICLLVSKTFGGETCVLVVSTVESFYWGEGYSVRPHKVNESGSSTKEIGDIDIYDAAGIVVASIEVKDKVFSKEDVDHAIGKFRASGVDRTMFVYGRSAKFERSEVFQVAARYGRTGYFCSVIGIVDYAKLRLTHMMHENTLADFVEQMLCCARKINAADCTVEWIKQAAQTFLCDEMKP